MEGDFMGYIKECVICEEEFETSYESKIYCSNKCQKEKNLKKVFESDKKKEIIKCKFCNDSFEKIHHGQKYCNKECRDNYYEEIYEKIVEVNCIKCGAEFKRKNSSVIKYCSDECKDTEKPKIKTESKNKVDSDNLKELITFKVENMLNKAKNTQPVSCFGVIISEFISDGFTDKIKEDVRNRDDNECQICSDNECKLEVHHILKRTLGGSNELDNLVTLCVNCHRAIETNDLEHAIKSCYKKACKVNGRFLGEKLTSKEKVISLRFCLEDIFNELNSEKGYELSEILIKLDKTLMETC